MAENIVLTGLNTSIDKSTVDITLSTPVDSPLNKNTSIIGKSIEANGVEVNSAQIKLKAQGDITLSNWVTSGKLIRNQNGVNINSSISIDSNANVSIKDCTIGQSGYNGIEICLASGYAASNILIENVDFTGVIDNVAILAFATKPNTTITLKNCHFNSVTNFFRLSNRDNVSGVTVNIDSCKIDKWGTNPSWPGGIIFEDYVSKTKDEVLQSNRYAPEKITFNIKNTIGPDGKVLNPSDLNAVISTFDKNQIIYMCNDKEITYEVVNGVIKITNPVKYNENKNRYPQFNFSDTITVVTPPPVEPKPEEKPVKNPAQIQVNPTHPDTDSSEWTPETGFNYENIAKSILYVFPGIDEKTMKDPVEASKVIKQYGIMRYFKRYPLEILLDKMVRDSNTIGNIDN